ncbi:MAG: response regulator transcription factor [Paludibacteraceae bacterium]
MAQHILIVDDEEDICQILSYSLQAAGYQTTVAHSAEEALPLIEQNPPDLLLLDIMMEGISGTDLAKRLQERGLLTFPVIFLTALTSESDVLKGFQLGADDYITKPFHLTEVLARVKAILRRTRTAAPIVSDAEHTTAAHSSLITYEGITINLTDKTLSIDNTPIPATRKELELLSFFLRHPGKMFSRRQVLDAVWEGEVYVLERTIDVHVTHLRKKLGAYADCLQTKSGYGYIWRA